MMGRKLEQGRATAAAEFAGRAFDPRAERVLTAGLLLEYRTDYTYQVVLKV